MYVILKKKTIFVAGEMGFRHPHTTTAFETYDTIEEALEHKQSDDVLLKAVDYTVTEKDDCNSVDIAATPPVPPRPQPNPTTTF